MIVQAANCNAYILAGGKSSRMGTDKGLLIIQNKAMIEYVIAPLSKVFNKVCIISNNSDYARFGLELIPDLIEDLGPSGGIYAALNHSDCQFNCILSCDMPFITAEGINILLANCGYSDITLFQKDGRVEPLVGVYAKGCLTLWKNLIDQNNRKLQEIVKHFSLTTIDSNNYKTLNSYFFDNVNTNDDFINALSRLKNEN